MIANAATDTFPIALQRDVQPGSIVRGKFRGLELVLWRDDADAIHVWEDRCPHRGVRLSAGRNLGDCLQAVYHGWKIGKDGSVIDIPAEGHAVRADVRVKIFPNAVAGGFVWINDGGAVNPPKLPAAVSEDAYVRPIYINAPPMVVSAALADIAELQLWVTPCDDNLSLIMGYYARRGPKPEALRGADQHLSRLRRAIEASRRP